MLPRLFLALAVVASSLALTASPAAADHQTYTYKATRGLSLLTYSEALLTGTIDFGLCQTATRDNGDRGEDDSWTIGQPYTDSGSTFRVLERTVTDGFCTITYTLTQAELVTDTWYDWILAITATYTRTHAENEAEDTVPIIESYEAAVTALLRDDADIHICKTEIRRNSSRSTGSWSSWRTYTDGGFDYRETSKTVADGRCEITYTYRELDFGAGDWQPDSLTIRVVRTPPKTNRVSGSGSDYAATVSNIAPGLAVCASEAAANASRSSGTWGYGNPYLPPGPFQPIFREATKIVNDGRCQITYTVTEKLDFLAWKFVKVTITVLEFVGSAPEPDDPPEGQGDRREGCSPAQANFHPHLCNSVETEEYQTQCIGRAAQMAPDLCKGAEIVPEKKPGDIYANQQSPTVQRWLEQERRKEENKRRHDAACAAKPEEPCPPYPYEQWARQRSD